MVLRGNLTYVLRETVVEERIEENAVGDDKTVMVIMLILA